MEHCMIDNKRCTKCCQVLTIKDNRSFRRWTSYIKRYKKGEESQDQQVYSMLNRISKRRAKKINPYLVSLIKNSQRYFTCKNLTKDGCSIYENRPYMCRGYPYYELTKEETLKTNPISIYDEDCTYYIKEIK